MHPVKYASEDYNAEVGVLNDNEDLIYVPLDFFKYFDSYEYTRNGSIYTITNKYNKSKMTLNADTGLVTYEDRSKFLISKERTSGVYLDEYVDGSKT